MIPNLTVRIFFKRVRKNQLVISIYFRLGVPCLLKGSVYDVWCDSIHIYIYDIIWPSNKNSNRPLEHTCLTLNNLFMDSGHLFIFVVRGAPGSVPWVHGSGGSARAASRANLHRLKWINLGQIYSDPINRRLVGHLNLVVTSKRNPPKNPCKIQVEEWFRNLPGYINMNLPTALPAGRAQKAQKPSRGKPPSTFGTFTSISLCDQAFCFILEIETWAVTQTLVIPWVYGNEIFPVGIQS